MLNPQPLSLNLISNLFVQEPKPNSAKACPGDAVRGRVISPRAHPCTDRTATSLSAPTGRGKRD